MAERNITSVDLLESVTNKTNAIVEENGTLNKVNLHNEFNTINTKIDNEVDTINANMSQLSNPNLLINSDFRNPINQRGQTTYSGSGNPYSIDRWRTLSSNVEIIEGGLSIYNTISTHSYFAQFFEKPYKGTYTLTLNVLTLDGTCVIYGDGFNEQQLVEGINVYHVTTNSNYNLRNIVLGLHPGSSIVIEYMKLEQGSIATPFVPRLYAEELALCKRFYQKYNGLHNVQCAAKYIDDNTIEVCMPLLASLRTSPTIEKFYSVYVSEGTHYGSWRTITDIIVDCIGNNIITLTLTSSSTLKAGMNYYLIMPNYGYIALDAEIY